MVKGTKHDRLAGHEPSAFETKGRRRIAIAEGLRLWPGNKHRLAACAVRLVPPWLSAPTRIRAANFHLIGTAAIPEKPCGFVHIAKLKEPWPRDVFHTVGPYSTISGIWGSPHFTSFSLLNTPDFLQHFAD